MSNLIKTAVGMGAGNGIQLVKPTGFIRRFIPLAPIIVTACIDAGPGLAQVVEYAKICPPGLCFSFLYVPGTDKCGYAKNLPYI